MVTKPKRTLSYTEPLATGEVSIDASPEKVYRLVSDPVAMAECAEELRKARWIRGASEAAVGNWFSGSNRNGWRRWVTHAEVTEAEPGRRFAYRVRTPFFVPISRWEYEIRPEGDGSRVIVTNWLRVPPWFVPFAIMITGQPDRAGTNRVNIAATLRRVKARVEGREWRV
ncbi:SRPBCC family protein [Amycolatopsis regifaucium]|uniref:Polyketide cyclase n=1 Tax=Amycolatopsis regifaucium TaxID=546365 RepID=A0A154M7G0_9PSEU|nr:SRPBCC family protein [Amycolatopsis regifaucium]KZB79789.1 polyketide cyclase [Amycolatopsis regifaucium]OKA09895.1 polyketide cyclase [Amycolatopsis regifaucium]SFI70615.1 Polyketide cyclase / dehydrase and lipid transport [Amycolatopsis regifaucium]